jgi:Cu/Ag efflux protein CusF
MDGFKQLISPVHHIGRSFALLAIGFGLQPTLAASAAEAFAPESRTVGFACPHGLVKSQMAAAHFNKIALDAVPDDRRGLTEVNYWSDVPPDHAVARDAIVHHIDNLVPALAERARPQETLRGVITGVDERSDRIGLRLPSDTIGEFKVQDGLIFNAVHNGDHVEITVEDVGGAKTIVRLKKEQAR